MSLAPGTKLGPYEIIAPLGAGGMGEVYRAKDARLGRDVAIKVLPESLVNDAGRRERFEREAKAVAALSHPNIINVFDTGVHEGHPFVVMELLDGETLRERVTGPIPVRKAVEIAVQIARGLGAAHDKQIVHRDLKPENIFILRDGQVKILDFGLAREMTPNSGATETRANITDAGIAMGTVGYMAPEQIRAQTVDGRTDLFAFGAVLFEMLSGRRAFQRETSADTMTAILKEDAPDLLATNAQVPPSLDRIVRHCLEKNAAERFQSARDVAFALDALSGSSISATVASGAVPMAPGPRRIRGWMWPVATAVLVVAASALTWWVSHASSVEPAEIRYDAKTFETQLITNARFGPDGQTIIYSAAHTGLTPSLYVVRPGEVAAQALAGPGTHLLSVSSTGELAVLTNATPKWGHRVYSGTLSRMTMNGAARPWMEGVTEADWSPDGSTIALIREKTGTWTLEYPAGTVLFTTTHGYLSDPRVSPDGTHVAFFDHGLSGDDRGSVKVADKAGVVKTLAGEFWGEEGTAWSRDSRTVYFSAALDGAQNYQVQTVEISGATKARRVLGSPGTLYGLDIAADGRMLVMSDSLRATIRVLVPGEAVERELPWLDFELGGRLTRDGKHLAFTDLSQSAGSDYAVAWRDTAGGPVVRIGAGNALTVSQDGRWIIASIPSSGLPVFYPTGPGEPIKLTGPVVSALVGTSSWLSDSAHALLCGTIGPSLPRCYRVENRSGAVPEAVTPEGVVGAFMGSDDQTLLMRMKDGTYRRSAIGKDLGSIVNTITPNDRVLGLSRDLKFAFVKSTTVPARIERIDLASGTRTLAKVIGPPDTSGVTEIEVAEWPENGGYSYTYFREVSQLFIVSGIKR